MYAYLVLWLIYQRTYQSPWRPRPA